MTDGQRVTIIAAVNAAGLDSEELAARPVGGQAYVVDSIPFVDTQLALGDIVECELVGEKLHVNRVLVRGGNSTLRILAEGVDFVSPLLGLGLRVEEGPGGVVAVSVAPDDPHEGLWQWLETLAAQGLVQVAPGYLAQS